MDKKSEVGDKIRELGGQKKGNGWTKKGRWVDKKREVGGQKKKGGWTKKERLVDKKGEVGGQKRRLHLQRGGRPVNLIGGNTNSDDGLRRIAST